ncbi:hypothetical protein [Pseudodesulfovibrio indicus]|uniref:hypothetical protein n=1 Tax=Pseudodesulfovibrio indicus TaxID=1716143 RepID=UPI00292D93B5|nr:hypothetical protein [Pseudodesulfovibrio indicus]
MQISTDIFSGGKDGLARLVSRERNITAVGEEAEVETPEIGGSPISIAKQLTPEEEQRVLFLQNLLAQTLAMADGNPSDEQRERIREIEQELEKITGVKVRSSLASATKNLPKSRDDEDEERNREKAYRLGIDPEEAKHLQRSGTARGDNPGMQMLRNNALLTSLALEDLFSGASG